MPKTLSPAKPGSLKAWLDYLASLNPEHMELGLSRVREVFSRLKLDALKQLPIVEVAGTNGKGSTAALTAGALERSGVPAGLYTSPHLHRFNERIVAGGREISDEDLCQALSEVWDAVRAGEFVPLTYFEYTTLAAFVCFARAGVQALVLEIGLGGRLDAVNILDADIACIASVGLDHVKILGNTLAQIASEKAGIIKKGAMVVSGLLPPEAREVVEAKAREGGAKLFASGRDFAACETPNALEYEDGGKTRLYPLPKVPLECAPLALKILGLLGQGVSGKRPLAITPEAVDGALSEVCLPGRMQLVHQKPDIYYDVAHNVPAAAHLKQALLRHQVKGRRYAVMGMLRDKDVEGVLRTLAPVFDGFFAASLHTGRGESAQRLEAALRSLERPPALVKSFEQVSEAYAACLRQCGPDDEIVVCGSFVTVTEASDFEKQAFSQLE